jgi:hypothetical protein
MPTHTILRGLALVIALGLSCLTFAGSRESSEPWRLAVEFTTREPDRAAAYRIAAALDMATTFVLKEHPQRYTEEVWPLSMWRTEEVMAFMAADVVWTPQVIAWMVPNLRDRANLLSALAAIRFGFFANNLYVEIRGRF